MKTVIITKTVEQKLQAYILQLNESQKQSVLQLLKTFVQGQEQKPERISLAQYNQEIDEALSDIKNGDVYSHEEAIKMSKDR